MTHCERIRSFGVRLETDGADLFVKGLKALEPGLRREVVELARTHKADLIRELTGSNRVDLAGLSERLRAAGLHLHPRTCDRAIQVIDKHGHIVPHTDTRHELRHIIENESRLCEAIIQARANGSTAGLCELCGWAGYSKHLSFGWYCGQVAGSPVALHQARENCPLAKRTLH